MADTILTNPQRDEGHAGQYGPINAEAFMSLACMEGIYEPIVEKPAAVEATKKAAVFVPGYIAAGVVAAAAYAVHALPLVPISAAIIAIVVGVVIRNVFPVPVSIVPGCKRTVKKVIPIAIVLTGAELNLSVVAQIGANAFLIIVLCIGVAVGASYYVGRWFGLGSRTAMLIGAGTGICGNSAIVAVAPLLNADDDDLVLSIGTINLFGLVTMLLCPLIGGWLHMSQSAFGVWSGTSIHAVPQVVAAGMEYGPEAGTIATLVKLVRVTLLAPLVVVLAFAYARRTASANTKNGLIVHYARFVPWFVWGFVIFAVLNTLGFIPTLTFQPAEFLSESGRELSLISVMSRCAGMLLTVAMAAIGLELNVRQLAGVGAKAISTGLVASAVLATVSLLLIRVLM